MVLKILYQYYTDNNRYGQSSFITSNMYDIERRCDMVSYAPLWQTMKDKNISTYTLIEKYKIPSKTIYNLKHNKNITTATLESLCNILECTPNDIITFDK